MQPFRAKVLHVNNLKSLIKIYQANDKFDPGLLNASYYDITLSLHNTAQAFAMIALIECVWLIIQFSIPRKCRKILSLAW